MTRRVKNNMFKQTHDKATQVFVHQLVAEAFVPNPMNYQYIKHIDGNKQNNNATNLRWVATLEEVDN